MTRKRLLGMLAILALAALPALAKPNFSGTWKLNVSKSSFGEMPPPTAMTNTITHADPALTASMKQSSDQGDFDFESKYTTDGKDCSNDMFGSPVKSNVKWDGDTLLIESKGKFGDSDFTSQEKWTLSADGKVLTMVRMFKSAMGEGEQKLVFEKQ